MARQPFDFYETPLGHSWALHRFGPILLPGEVICDPCVGDGALLLPFRAGCEVEPSTPLPDVRWITGDIDPARQADVHGDARMTETWQALLTSAAGRPIDWVLTNPPFSAAMPILQAALPRVRYGVILHLRVSFLEPVIEKASKIDRGAWLFEHPPSQQITLPRYKFDPASGGSDMATTMWCVWLTAESRLYRRRWESRPDGDDEWDFVTVPKPLWRAGHESWGQQVERWKAAA